MESYRQSRIRLTAEQFERAWRVAASCGATDLELSARFWHGAALHGEGRLSEALAVWAPVLATDTPGRLGGDYYMMLTRYVLVAVDLPLPLGVIERALAAVEERAARSSGHGARSRLLLARSRLALARGNARESLELGLEGLVRRRIEHHAYSYSTHYRTLTQAGLLAGEPDLVEDLLDEWDGTEPDYPEAKRIALATARAGLARCRDNPDEAIAHLEAVMDGALRSEEVGPAVDASCEYVRVTAAAGVPVRARPAVRYLLRFRRASMGALRFRAMLMLGDYHAACARSAGDERSAQPMVRAVRSYEAARSEAVRIDELLVTSYRRDQIARRLASGFTPGGTRGPSADSGG